MTTEETAAAVRALAERVQDGDLPLADREAAAHELSSLLDLAGENGTLANITGLAALAEQARRALAAAQAAAEATAARAVDKLADAAHDVVDPATGTLAEIQATAKKAAIGLAIGVVAVPVIGLIGFYFLARTGARAGYAAAPAVAKYGGAVLPFAPELAPVVAAAGLANAHRNARAGVQASPEEIGALVAQLRGGARAPASSPSTTPDALQALAGLERLFGGRRSQSLKALNAMAPAGTPSGPSATADPGMAHWGLERLFGERGSQSLKALGAIAAAAVPVSSPGAVAAGPAAAAARMVHR